MGSETGLARAPILDRGAREDFLEQVIFEQKPAGNKTAEGAARHGPGGEDAWPLLEKQETRCGGGSKKWYQGGSQGPFMQGFRIHSEQNRQ